MLTKICSSCGVEKPIDEFYNRVGSKDGVASACKLCNNAVSKLYREKNPQLAKDYAVAYKKKIH